MIPFTAHAASLLVTAKYSLTNNNLKHPADGVCEEETIWRKTLRRHSRIS
jgi:hypothetical protein